MNRYAPGLVDWVKTHYMEYDIRELTKQINERFGTSMKENAVKDMKFRYGLKGSHKSKVYTRIFPKEICDFIEGNYKGTGYRAMIELLKENFGKEYTPQQIKGFYRSRRLNSGLTGQFKKGQEPFNKGKKLSPEHYAKVAPTMFKKGNRPVSALPVGSRVQEDGYWKTKIAEPDVWEFDHRLIWQQSYGSIPKGMLVSFKDSNHDNLDPENLMLITREEHLWLTQNQLRSKNPEITDAALNTARLVAKVRKLKGEKRNE